MQTFAKFLMLVALIACLFVYFFWPVMESKKYDSRVVSENGSYPVILYTDRWEVVIP